VAPDSTVETFVALRLQVDPGDGQGVPFYIRAGNAARDVTQVVVRLRQPPTMYHGFDSSRTTAAFRISTPPWRRDRCELSWARDGD